MLKSGPRTTAATFGSIKGAAYAGTAANNTFHSTANDMTLIGVAGAISTLLGLRKPRSSRMLVRAPTPSRSMMDATPQDCPPGTR